MGVPALFRWLSKKYPKTISNVIEERPVEVDGELIPVDTTGPNPNGEVDNLYLDMNGIVHPCSHPEDRPPPQTEGEMMLEVFKYTDRVVNMVRPRRLLMIAVDGVAPRAKMNQQRSRRFRSAQEAKEKEENQAEFIKMLRAGGKEIHECFEGKKVWDSNAITPGTPFMDILAMALRYWVAYKYNTDPGWAKLKVIISDSTIPGEGEHKIMEFIRSQRASPEHDPNTRHVIYGLDADLIMLGLGTHEPHFRVLREDVFFQEAKARHCKLCGQKGHKAEECTGKPKEKIDEFDSREQGTNLKPFIWLHVGILREYLAVELEVPGQPFNFDLERAIDDWVFMCFFVGNDFLPHLPSLDIRDGAIDTLISIWRENLPVMGGYVTKDGVVNLERAQFILDSLAKQEDAIFRRRKQNEDRQAENAKRRKLEQENKYAIGSQIKTHIPPEPAYLDTITTPTTPVGKKAKDPVAPPPGIHLFTPGDVSKETKRINHDMIMNRGALRQSLAQATAQANAANKSAAAVLKAQLISGAVEKSTRAEAKDEVEQPTPVKGETPATEPKYGGPPASAIHVKRKAEMIEDSGAIEGDISSTPDSLKGTEGEPDLDAVRLWEPGYRDRYYEQKFKVAPDDLDFRKKVAHCYVEGLCWVLLYYFQGCPSWNWYYPYHYAPFAADFQDLKSLEIKFVKGKPFKPFEQLMGVLPAASKHNLPEPFQHLMTSEDSEIIDFYPDTFPIDLNGKKFAWQGVALLPFIDEKRLLEAVHKQYDKLTPEDHARNAMGKDVLYMSDQHPLYNELASQFYSKKRDVNEVKLKPNISEGLSGIVEKDDAFIPRSTIRFPLDEGKMPDLEEDRTMCVTYMFPKAKVAHKSMLLRGVKLAPPVLTRVDLEVVRNKAANGGRYNGPRYGAGASGVHRSNNGRGRGGGQGIVGGPGGDSYTPRGTYNNNDQKRKGEGHYPVPSWTPYPPLYPPPAFTGWPPTAPNASWSFPPPPPPLPTTGFHPPTPGSAFQSSPPLHWSRLTPTAPPPAPPNGGFSYGYPPSSFPPPPPASSAHGDGHYSGQSRHDDRRRDDRYGDKDRSGHSRDYRERYDGRRADARNRDGYDHPRRERRW